jgi:hypothetical protein
MPDRETAVNVRTGETAVTEVPTAQEAVVAALLRERAGYVLRGLDARVEAVDAELERLGAPQPKPAKTPPAGRRKTS